MDPKSQQCVKISISFVTPPYVLLFHPLSLPVSILHPPFTQLPVFLPICIFLYFFLSYFSFVFNLPLFCVIHLTSLQRYYTTRFEPLTHSGAAEDKSSEMLHRAVW